MIRILGAQTLLTFALAASAVAQNVSGTIVGTVKDATGAVVPNASIVAVNTATQAAYRSVSDSDGEFAVRLLPAGLYSVTCEAAGFRRYEAAGIRVQVNETARIAVNLALGSTTESITVSAQVTSVDTSDATIKTVVDTKRIEELPLNGRNPTQLTQLVAGVVVDTRSNIVSATAYPGATPISVNGGRSNTVNYMLDGAQNNDHYNNAPNPMPNPDALQEFSVQTNNFSAEFGRNSGGIVNAVTKSGSNQVHGSAFEYLRNNAVNAANFFAPIVGGVKKDDGLKRNQFGTTFGGPVYLPKLYQGRDRTFFFFSYQGTRTRQAPAVSQIVVPTAAQRAGDFTGFKQLRDPNGGNYPNNQIPASALSPVTRLVLEHIPVPAAGNTVFTAAPNNMDDDQFLVRIDHQFTAGNRLSGRYWRSFASTPAYLNPLNYLELTTGRTWLNTSVSLTNLQTLSPRLVNQTLFSFNRTLGTNDPQYPDKSMTALGIKMWDDPIHPQWRFNVAGYFEINTVGTNRFPRDEYQFADTLRWSTGRHEVAFGMEFTHALGDIDNNYRSSGFWNFNGNAPFTGNSLSDFLIGKFNTMTQGIGEYKMNRFNIFNLFVNDSFKVSRRLTVNLGLRWEPFFPFTDVDGKLAAWHPGQRSTRYRNAPPGVLFIGDAGVPDGGYPTVWTNFGPRAGLAWDVSGDGRTSVRAAYGIFFDHPNTVATNSLADQAPFGTVITVNGNSLNSFADPWAGTVNPFPMSRNPGPDAFFPANSTYFMYVGDMRNPYVQAWNMTVERQVPAGFVVRASYAGSKGTRLSSLREMNAAVYAPGATTATTNQRRPLAPNMGSSTLIEPVSNSTYHALQLTAERRFQRGFSVLANYQFAKSIDDNSSNMELAADRTNPYNQRFDKGLSDFDRRHVFHLSTLWELPLRPQNRILRGVAGGWNINGIVGLLSGYPFTVLSGVDNARSGTSNQRVDLVGNPYFAGGRSRPEEIAQWLQKSAFAANALGTFGNLGRNVFTGPGMVTVDLGLVKHFRPREWLTTTLRFETFNAFNRVNLAGPDAAANSANFMRTTAAYDPRILQFALRLSF